MGYGCHCAVILYSGANQHWLARVRGVRGLAFPQQVLVNAMKAVLLIVALDIAGYVWLMHEVGNVANIWSSLEVLTR